MTEPVTIPRYQPVRPVQSIARDVAIAFDVRLDRLVRPGKRSREVTLGRWALAWTARQTTGKSLSVIARYSGFRDHTSALHAVRRAEALRQEDESFRAVTDALVSKHG